MKIAFINSALACGGGVETWTKTLISGMKEQCIGVGILAPRISTVPNNFFEIPLYSNEEAINLAKQSDVVITWGLDKHQANILADLPNKPKIIFVVHGDLVSKWQRGVLETSYRFADHIVSVNDTDYQFKVPHTVIPNCVGNLRSYMTKRDFREKEKIGDNNLIVIYSRLDPHKQLHKVAQAMNYLPNTIALIYGLRRRGVKDYFNQLNHIQIRYPGYTADHTALAAADISICTSAAEGFCLSNAECLKLGIPLVSTPVGFLKTKPELAKIISHTDTPEDIANSVKEVLNNKKETTKRVLLAQEYVSTNYSFNIFISRWRELIYAI